LINYFEGRIDGASVGTIPIVPKILVTKCSQ